jgi:hypothetical protein
MVDDHTEGGRIHDTCLPLYCFGWGIPYMYDAIGAELVESCRAGVHDFRHCRKPDILPESQTAPAAIYIVNQHTLGGNKGPRRGKASGFTHNLQY